MAVSSNPHLRKCAGCGILTDKKDMIRVVRSGDRTVLIDDTQKKNGRGAYLCRSVSCLETARKRRGLEHSLRCAVDQDLYDLIRERIEAAE